MKKTPKDRRTDRHVSPRIVFHLDEQLYSALTEHAASIRPETHLSAVVRQAVREYLKSKNAFSE